MSSVENPRKRSEQAFVQAAHRRLRSLDVPTKWEAPLLGRSVDLVFYKDGAVHSIEFKLKDWRRAITQARDHQLGADFAYICLPGKTVTEAMRQAAEEKGIGILELRESEDWPFCTVVPAKRSTDQWTVARENLINLLNPSVR